MDKSLGTLLRALQSRPSQEDVSRLLGSAATLLTLLSNPLNITLLTSQLLSTPSIWERPDGQRTPVSILNVFTSAANHRAQRKKQPSDFPQRGPTPGTLSEEDWAIAVTKGADDRSPPWRHLCVLVGLLTGFGGGEHQSISASLRRRLEGATIRATNLALQDSEHLEGFAQNSVAVMLSYAFDGLSDVEKLNLNHDLLLPILYRTPLFAREGLHSGYFLSSIDADVVQNDSKFNWSSKSSTYFQLQRKATGPIVATLGPMSRFAAFSVEHVRDVDLLLTMVSDMSTFTRSLYIQWRQNKLSEIDITEEATFLSDETLKITLPLLWRVMKATMFAVVIIQRSVLGRVLRDPKMPIDGAPMIALQTLHMLRNLYFISSRLGANAFSQYTFVYMAALDILSRYPVQAEAFLREIRPTSTGQIPQHPLDRCLDLYFLNTAEHLTTTVTPDLNEELVINAATTYLGLGGDLRLLELFEAAHSAMLTIFSSPHNTALLEKHIMSYIDVLFNVFPRNLSPRQFRMAIKVLVRVTSRPYPTSRDQPLLAPTILELVLFRLRTASPTPLPEITAPSSNDQQNQEGEGLALSEQAVLVLALIDALALLSIDQLEEWLITVAESLQSVQDPDQLQICRQRFWEALSAGEMDVERASLCVNWWGTKEGRELVLHGLKHQSSGPFMSGALQDTANL